MATILGENFTENVKMEIDDGDASESCLSRFCELLHIKDGRLESTFWSGGMTGN
jgi:hypothetical protein